ncbi:MAG: dihydroorotase [Acidobacteria bacterium]|nr:MAG: dihydroorotase [Acidobacteriota bacterium]
MKRLLKGGRVVDPANGIDGVRDILIDGERIARVGLNLPFDAATVVEIADGLVICPGFIDMHVHLREPGQEHKETVATGTASAVAGGFTAVACMPNTNPVNDDANVTTYMHPTKTAILLRRALEYAAMFGMPVIEHCEDPSLKGDGVVHEGYWAASLGLRGMPGACEALGVERGVLLAELTGSAFHVAHMSARASLRAVRRAKEAGIRVTCEVAPHHFTLTDEALAAPIAYDTNTKMNPPLREAADRDAMLDGIADGSVDAIATDHAPHHYDEKKVEYDRAPFGIVGLETAVPLSLDRLVHAGRIRLSRMVELLSVNPARILNVPGGSLSEGAPADITIIAPDVKVKIDAGKLRSRSKNTPFDGWELRGGVAATIVGGRPLYVNADTRLAL